MSDFPSFTKTWHHQPYPAIDPTRPALSAVGKFVVVTGGGTGIGKAIAIAFAKAGAQYIAILGRRLNKLEETALQIRENASNANTKVLLEKADLSKRESIDAAAASLVDKADGAKIDILVTNAGVMPETGPVVGYSEAALRHGLDLNVVAPFNTIQAFAPLAVDELKIVNVSSGLAHVQPMTDSWVYCCSKAAVIKMFDFVLEENPDWHIVQMHPGVVATEMNASNPVEGVQAADHPELPGNFSVWLTSRDATFLRGKFVWVNWDVEELKARAEEIKNSLLLNILLHGLVM